MPSDSIVIVIGGANNEKILIYSGKELQLGIKVPVSYSYSYGGSGLNYTSRLINVGRKVYPILGIGDDEYGINIRNNLIRMLANTDLVAEVEELLLQKSFLCPGFMTPWTTIIVEQSPPRRTIFRENTNNHLLRDFFENRLNNLRVNKVGALMIGHIPFSEGVSEFVSKAIQKFNEEAVIFMNFGFTQFSLGFYFWEKILNRTDILQINLTEAQQFFFTNTKHKLRIKRIIKKLRSFPFTSVLTLGKRGAIVLSKFTDAAIWVKPFPSLKILDYTGAGDAFGAGLINGLAGKKNFTQNDLSHSLLLARLFAAYACTTFGGALNCPTIPELIKFSSTDTEDIPIEYIKDLDFFE